MENGNRKREVVWHLLATVRLCTHSEVGTASVYTANQYTPQNRSSTPFQTVPCEHGSTESDCVYTASYSMSY